MDIARTLQEAVRLHQQGQLAEAEPLYRQVLAVQPRNPDALHLLGVLASQCGNPDAAIQLIRSALEVRPNDVEAMKNLGRVLADKGEQQESLAVYRRVTELAPNDPMGWYAYAICCRKADDLTSAAKALNRVIKFEPRFGEAFSELGAVNRAQGNLDEAVRLLKRAVELQPNSASAFNNLGNALKDSELYEEAVTAFRRAIQLDPAQVSSHVNLGNTLGLKKEHLDALKEYDWAVHLNANSIEAHCGRAQALTELGLFDQATAANERALAIAPGNLPALISSAATYSEMQQMETAIAFFRRAIELDPKSTAHLKGIGTALRSIGRFDEANDYLRQALRVDPTDTATALVLSSASREPAEQEIERLKSQLTVNSIAEIDRVMGCFALGKLLDDTDRFDEAFSWYRQGNELHRAKLAKEGERFDRGVLEKNVTGMIATFVPEFFKQRSSWGSDSEVPVFIVGMPRSGTTLVEQILASHSQVYGAGELSHMNSYAITLGKDKPEPVCEHWRKDEIVTQAEAHLAYLHHLSPTARRVVDKMPANILNLGLIATMFPRARVIFCNRDPRDNCLSCYFQIFKNNSLAMTYDLQDCAMQYLEQERLRSHWLRALPLPMLSLQYEELVADLEGQTRRLIDFVGLDWESACLDFHKTERSVITASVWQVRQPLYSSSVGRWRHYEKHLGPLLAALSG